MCIANSQRPSPFSILPEITSRAPTSASTINIHDRGLVAILRQLHDDLDTAVFDAYGWPSNLTDDQLLENLVALNHQRAQEESRGIIKYLRPDFQALGNATPVPAPTIRNTRQKPKSTRNR